MSLSPSSSCVIAEFLDDVERNPLRKPVSASVHLDRLLKMYRSSEEDREQLFERAGMPPHDQSLLLFFFYFIFCYSGA